MTKIRENRNFPISDDLNGAATALIRLQITYRLNTTDLANGIIRNKHYL